MYVYICNSFSPPQGMSSYSFLSLVIFLKSFIVQAWSISLLRRSTKNKSQDKFYLVHRIGGKSHLLDFQQFYKLSSSTYYRNNSTYASIYIKANKRANCFDVRGLLKTLMGNSNRDKIHALLHKLLLHLSQLVFVRFRHLSISFTYALSLFAFCTSSLRSLFWWISQMSLSS